MTTRFLPLAAFCKIGSGGTPSRAKLQEYYGGSIPWVKSGELREKEILDTEEHITARALRETNVKIVPKGAVLLAMYGATVGRTAILGTEAATNQAVCNLLPDPMICDVRYLLYCLRSKVPELLSRRVGGAQPNISQAIIKSILIPIPSLAEQSRIAQIFDVADMLVEKRQMSLSLLGVLEQSLFMQMFGDPAHNKMNWNESTIADIAIKVTDGEHKTPVRTTKGIKLLSARNIKDGYLDFDAGLDFISQAEHEKIKRRCNPEFGDVLVSCSGTIGHVATVTVTEPLSMVRSVALIKPDHNRIDSLYLETYLRMPYLKSKMLQRANASSQANLFLNQINQLPVLLPPLALQSEFARRIEAIRILARTQTESLEHLTYLSKALQQELFHFVPGREVSLV